jgi:molecular chaperone GrpE
VGKKDRDKTEGRHEIPVEDEDEVMEERVDAGKRGMDKTGRKGTGRRKTQDLEHEVDELSAELEKVRTELDQTKDKLLRGLADFDNYRKRVVRERERLTKCANEELIKRLLEVIDNIERALGAADETHDLEAFKKGIELIDQHMKDILTKEGLCPIECVGETFDPNYHEAVMALDKEGVESEKVVEEVQKGYLLDGRVIRPSKVIVSK